VSLYRRIAYGTDMLLRQEKIALLLLLTVTLSAVCGYLVLDALGKGSFAAQYSDAAADGTPVRLDGQVNSVTVSRTGGHLILEVSDVPVFVPGQVAGGISIKKDDRVTITGTVQTYQGKKEILVNDPRDIILSRSEQE
jgi:hypothetical protein